MVFGLFAALIDTPLSCIIKEYYSLLEQLVEFENNESRRDLIVELSASNSGLSVARLDQYFGEVFNRLDDEHINGLNKFLKNACGLTQGAEFVRL